MNRENHWVEIVQYGDPEQVVKTMGPFTWHIADKICDGACRNYPIDTHFARVVKK